MFWCFSVIFRRNRTGTVEKNLVGWHQTKVCRTKVRCKIHRGDPSGGPYGFYSRQDPQ
jgi:hypothetical protein